MELKDLQGKKFKCDKGEGRINVVEKGGIISNTTSVFLCQNFRSGANIKVLYGYMYSYVTYPTDISEFFTRISNDNDFPNFKLLVSEEESKSLTVPVTDFKEGTIVTVYRNRELYIEKVDGNLVFVIEDKDGENENALVCSKRELLELKPIIQFPIEIVEEPSEEEFVYVSVEDVAKMMGKDPSKVFIKE